MADALDDLEGGRDAAAAADHEDGVELARVLVLLGLEDDFSVASIEELADAALDGEGAVELR